MSNFIRYDAISFLKRLVTLAVLTISQVFLADTVSAQVDNEIQAALKQFPNLKLVSIKEVTGRVHILKSHGLISNDLNGISLQDYPPVLRRKLQPDRDQPKPYEAKGIGPFRLNHFNCQFNYGGRYNYQMQDYAATHGFNSIYPFRRTTSQISALPTGTKIAQWKGIAKYRDKWWQDHSLPKARYDLLNGDHFWSPADKKFKGKNIKQTDLLMLDMEHALPLEIEKLKKQKWYPKTNQKEFSQRYYSGYAQSLTSTIQAYRNHGYKAVSIYGWSPQIRSWFPMLADKPLNRDFWEAYGKYVCDSVDVIHNSVYCPYADSKNVAFVLASIDENVRRVQELDNPKPVRPYFWPLISGGGSHGFRWEKEVPHLNEDQEAMTAMAFFLGIDGLVIWNWSGKSSHHVASTQTFMGEPSKRTLMVSKSFRIDDSAGQAHLFSRYDYLHALDIQDGAIKFQKILPHMKKNNYGISPEQPIFHTKYDLLTPFLRPRSEPVAAIVRAMALIKPFELSIRNGTPQQDFNLREAFRKNHPLYRRVKNGNYHLVITYNPHTIRSGVESNIILENFDGNQGLDLVFPADQHPRIYILSD